MLWLYLPLSTARIHIQLQSDWIITLTLSYLYVFFAKNADENEYDNWYQIVAETAPIIDIERSNEGADEH